MTELAPSTPRKRRRWIGAIIALVVLVLLVVGFVVADSAARSYAQGYVRERVASALALDPSAKIDVDFGAGSVLLQAATGSIGRVKVDVSRMTVGNVVGDARLTITDVPLDSSKPVGALDLIVTVDESNVRTLASSLTGGDPSSIDLTAGVIRVGTSLSVSAVSVPVSLDLKPSATPGGVSFEPVSVRVGTQNLSVADLRASPQFGPLVTTLLAPREFCIAGSLPRALTLESVAVEKRSLVVRVTGEGAVLGGPELTERGTCPTP